MQQSSWPSIGRFSTTCLFFVFLFGVNSWLSAATPTGLQQIMTADEGLSIGKINSYLLYIPESYHDEPSKKWPMIVHLHGNGTKGTDINKLKQTGIPKQIIKGDASPMDFVVVSPLLSEGSWTERNINTLANHIRDNYNVDSNRLLITGQSLGGIFTMNTVVAAPLKYAGAAPVAGRLKPGTSDTKLNKIKDIPIWYFHGDQDTTVKYHEALDDYNRLIKLGASALQFTVYQGIAHNSWDLTYDRDDLYEWFLEQELPGSNPGPSIHLSSPDLRRGVLPAGTDSPLQATASAQADGLNIVKMKTFLDGALVEDLPGSSLDQAQWFKGLLPGTYTLRVSALDSGGRENWVQHQIHIQSTNRQDPSITIQSPSFPNTFYRRDTIPLQAHAVDRDGSIRAMWADIDGQRVSSTLGSSLVESNMLAPLTPGEHELQVDHRMTAGGNHEIQQLLWVDHLKPLTPGEHTLSVWAEDNEGRTSRVQKTFTVTEAVPPSSSPEEPVARFIWSQSVLDAHRIAFDGQDSSDDHGHLQYHWDFGDGHHLSTSTPQAIHKFTTPGSYTVSLTVTDEANQSRTSSHSLTINDISSPKVKVVKELRDELHFYEDRHRPWSLSLNTERLKMMEAPLLMHQHTSRGLTLSQASTWTVDTTSGDITLDLPWAINHKGQRYHIIKNQHDDHHILIRTRFGDRLDGQMSWILSTSSQEQKAHVELFSDGQQWWTSTHLGHWGAVQALDGQHINIEQSGTYYIHPQTTTWQVILPQARDLIGKTIELLNLSRLNDFVINTGLDTIHGQLDVKCLARTSGSGSKVVLQSDGKQWLVKQGLGQLDFDVDGSMRMLVDTSLVEGKQFWLQFHNDQTDFPILIDWGDGTQEIRSNDTVNAGGRAQIHHDFSSHADTFIVTLTPLQPKHKVFFDMRYGKIGRILKDVLSWGHFEHVSLQESFKDCAHLNVSAIDPIRVSGTNINKAFEKCSSLQSAPHMLLPNTETMLATFMDCVQLKSVPHLNTSTVKNFENAWKNCSLIESFPSLDMASLTTAKGTFSGVSLPGSTWDDILVRLYGKWPKPSSPITMDGGNSVLLTDAGQRAKAQLQKANWVIRDGSVNR
jgi:predicted esterase/PKD repeat protein